jgi:hypothetical protein
MKIRTVCFFVLLICLTTGLAVAGECKPIRGQVGASVYLPPCEYQGVEYEFCIETPVKGTLNGVWRYYGPLGNDGTSSCQEWQPPLTTSAFDSLVVELNACHIAGPQPGYSGMAAGWALDVFVTEEGELWAQDAYVFHYDTWFVGEEFVFSTTSYITGGTGKFEGVTGWLGFVGSEVEGGIIFGKYCKP